MQLITDDEYFKVVNWMMGKTKFNDDGTPSMLDDLRIFIMMSAIGLIVLLVVVSALVVKKF